jgi:hypothetical protein
MSSQKSRAEKMADELGRSDLSGDEYQREVESNQFIVDKENADIWALYRSLDVSQSEVIDMLTMLAEPSQSTITRVIREKDKEVLTDAEAVQVGGSFFKEDLGAYPDEWLEAYRQTVADAHTDLHALSKIADTQETPEWAARRFPELVGLHRVIAEKQGWDGEIADESHLNRLDSVNTDRWK